MLLEFGTGYETIYSPLCIIDTDSTQASNNDSTSSSATYIIPSTPDPIASFTYEVKSGGTVAFTDASENTTSWSWSFGDGTTSTQQNPVHIYEAYQGYTVNLTVKNTYGGTASYSTLVTTVDMTPTADFTYVVGGLTVYFTNTSNKYGTSYSWTFGDGYTSTSQNPSHTYSSNGTYLVELTVDDSYTKQASITIDCEMILSCDAVEGASGYIWERSANGLSKWAQIADTVVASVGITQAGQGVNSTEWNYFRVKAYSDWGESEYSSVVEIQCY